MTTEIDKSNNTSMENFPKIINLIFWTRWLSIITVLSSLVGALLMFVIGAANTAKAVIVFVALNPEIIGNTNFESDENANLFLLESLDNSLTGLTFFYFAYGIYSLFLANSEFKAETPAWLDANSIADLKKTLLEVVVVLLSIVFVRNIVQELLSNSLQWEILILPVSIVAIALSIKLMGFKEK